MDGSRLVAQLPEIVDLYLAVYAEPPYDSGAIWHEQAFIERTARQAAVPGFDGRTARLADGTLVGFTFGLPFEPGRWWAGATPPPGEVLAAEKFAVIELVVRRDRRGQGLGRALLDGLLGSRSEPFATLTAVPDAPARAFYAHLGWASVGEIAAGEDRPRFAVLALPLRHQAAPSTVVL